MGTTNTDSREIIDLEPVVTADGHEEWVAAGQSSPPSEVERTQLVVDAGTIAGAHGGQQLSTMPTERMAGGKDWNRIIGAIAAAEAGEDTDTRIVVEPGGGLVPVASGQAGPQLSVIPEERMAATARASRSDLQAALQLDPSNVEGWRFIEDHTIPGLEFTMTPAGEPFTFFCFRDPSLGGRWYLTVLEPNLDSLVGHKNHMLRLRMGSEFIPVICSKSGSPTHREIAEVRGAAAKFALYHTLRSRGHVPFSA